MCRWAQPPGIESDRGSTLRLLFHFFAIWDLLDKRPNFAIGRGVFCVQDFLQIHSELNCIANFAHFAYDQSFQLRIQTKLVLNVECRGFDPNFKSVRR